MRALENIPADAASLHDWNDALDYLTQASPASTTQEARARLMARIEQPRQYGVILKENRSDEITI